jgi:carboxyl-terminal processing protease
MQSGPSAGAGYVPVWTAQAKASGASSSHEDTPVTRSARTTVISLLLLLLVGLSSVPAGPALANDRPGRRAAELSAASSDQQARTAQPPAAKPPPGFADSITSGSLFDNVAAVLTKRYFDRAYRTTKLPALIREHASRANAAVTPADQRDLVQAFLARIPSSHLGLLSADSHANVMNDLRGTPYPTVGFQLVGVDGELYVHAILEGGPAHIAGLLPWDRIITIDGVAARQSERLDWRTDDAALPDDRDPPVHSLKVRSGEMIRLTIERRRGDVREFTVAVAEYSALHAARASARVFRQAGRSIGYLHLSYIHAAGLPKLLQETFAGEFGACDGVILDLRGRGGSASEVAKILEFLKVQQQTRRLALVALVDRQTRSAKEVLAYEMKTSGVARLVGERTSGAVVGAAFADVGHGAVLLFPVVAVKLYTDRLEGKGVEPDVAVERASPFSSGTDPILDAGLAEAVRMIGDAAGRVRGAAPPLSHSLGGTGQFAGFSQPLEKRLVEEAPLAECAQPGEHRLRDGEAEDLRGEVLARGDVRGADRGLGDGRVPEWIELAAAGAEGGNDRSRILGHAVVLGSDRQRSQLVGIHQERHGL